MACAPLTVLLIQDKKRIQRSQWIVVSNTHKLNLWTINIISVHIIGTSPSVYDCELFICTWNHQCELNYPSTNKPMKESLFYNQVVNLPLCHSRLTYNLIYSILMKSMWPKHRSYQIEASYYQLNCETPSVKCCLAG